MGTLIAGATLSDQGKLIEYVLEDGRAVVGRTGKLLRQPFSGVALAMRFGLPDEVCHMIATYTGKGNLGKRTVESSIVHHIDSERGALLALGPVVDTLALAGVGGVFPWLGAVVAGLLLGRGANWIRDFVSW